MSSRLIFDVTTSIRWKKNLVGIVRVEAELASRAEKYWPGPVVYCYYDGATRDFYEVKRDAVRRRFDDDMMFDFPLPTGASAAGASHAAPSTPGSTGALRHSIVRKIQAWALLPPNAPTYRRWLRRLQLAALSFIARESELRAFHERQRRLDRNEPVDPQPKPDTGRPPNPHFGGAIAFAPDDVYATAGIDWEHKDINRLCELKQAVGFRYVSFCYDIIPLLFPEFCSPGYVQLIHGYFSVVVQESELIVCISKQSELDLQAYWKERRFDHVRSTWIHLGCDPRRKPKPAALPAPLEGKQFVLMVSTIEPRKNHRFAYEVWKYIVANELVPENYCLVFAGAVGGYVEGLIEEIRHCDILNGRLILLNDVNDDLLASLYQKCAFTIFPTFYEGFGLPLVESLYYNKVCIPSDRGSLREITPPFLTCLEPHDFHGWVAEIARLINEPPRLRELETRISQYTNLTTWEQSATQFYKAIAAIAAIAGPSRERSLHP
jgi:glycosyltransferase involved in cell wall biosynthesis